MNKNTDNEKSKGIFGLQRPIEFDQTDETIQPINSKAKDAMVERLKDLGAQVVSNTKHPFSSHAFEEQTSATNYPLSGHAFEEQTSATENPNTNKLATLRKKIAHDIDETLGTHLEEKKIAKPLKKIEKVVSDKLFGKVNE